MKDDTKVITMTTDFVVNYMNLGRGMIIIPHHIDKFWRPNFNNTSDPGDCVLLQSIYPHGKLLKQFENYFVSSVKIKCLPSSNPPF